MEKKETLEITPRLGSKFIVDISDKACLEFGFKHKDTIIDPAGDEGIVMGVGFLKEAYTDRKALWYIEKGHEKAICYGYGNLREAGARLKGEEKKKKK